IHIKDLPAIVIALKKCASRHHSDVVPVADCIEHIAFQGGLLILGGCEIPPPTLRDMARAQIQEAFFEPLASSFARDTSEPDLILSWSRDAKDALRQGKRGIMKWLRALVQAACEMHRNLLQETLDEIRAEEDRNA